MESKKEIIRIYLTLRMFLSRNMEEEQVTSGLRDIVRPKEFKMRFLR